MHLTYTKWWHREARKRKCLLYDQPCADKSTEQMSSVPASYRMIRRGQDKGVGKLDKLVFGDTLQILVPSRRVH